MKQKVLFDSAPAQDEIVMQRRLESDVPHTRPDFLHIGLARSGSSWLHNMLKQHPDVQLPPIKEIRYLSELYCYPGEGLFGRFRKGDAHNGDYRAYLVERLRRYLRYPHHGRMTLERLRWDLSYLFGKRSDRWFERLFQCDETKLTGDFSPQTQNLPPQDVARIAREWPAIKVTLALRDPVDWAWSCARMWLIGEREAAELSDDELRAFVGGFALEYPSVPGVAMWKDAFADRFKLLYFDAIVSDPAAVLVEVCEFLGLATAPIADFEGGVETRYSSRPQPMPERFRQILIERYLPEMTDLADHYGGYAQHWLEQYTRSKAG